MNGSGHLSERMPAVALGQQAWTAEDQRHLGSCGECAAEWLIVHRTARLGTEAASSLDVAQVAEGVRRRLRERPPTRRTQRPLVRWALVGAIAALLALAAIFRPDAASVAVPVAEQALLPELEGLNVEELEAMFEALPSSPGLPEIGLPGIGDLTEDEIESVLRTLEG